jgi:pimeloyl-ACP methyl ester carboxylesterase
MHRIHAFLALATLLSLGCVEDKMYMTPQRKQKGLVLILPGIEGPSPFNANIKRGVINSGLDYAVTVYPWGLPGLALVNQMDFLGNRLRAGRLADYIEEYQNAHPGKPVWIIGHSGGGGIAVFAAEALEPGHKVNGLVLLAASISKDYNLRKALAKVDGPIVNFYNPDDSALLAVGTTLTSNVDGRRGPSAGLEGFSNSYPGLHEVPVYSSSNPHGAATEASFVRNNVVPWIRRNSTGSLARD